VAVPPAHGAPLPPLAFEDQHGGTLALAALRGAIGVIVYGDRHAMDESITWGRRLKGALPPDVQIVAVAQMGGIPGPFRGLLRTAVRERAPADFSLWLDWEDRLGAVFGRHARQPTVVVADRHGEVRLVVTGPPQGAAWDAVLEQVRGLR
jgi:hypothetical protein